LRGLGARIDTTPATHERVLQAIAAAELRGAAH
jgi:hypothetical protein